MYGNKRRNPIKMLSNKVFRNTKRGHIVIPHLKFMSNPEKKNLASTSAIYPRQDILSIYKKREISFCQHGNVVQ